MDAKEFGLVLKDYRESHGLTLEDIGLMVEPNATKSTVKKWELGKNFPNPERLSQLAEVLKIDANEVERGNQTEKALAAILAEQRETNDLLLKILEAVRGGGNGD